MGRLVAPFHSPSTSGTQSSVGLFQKSSSRLNNFFSFENNEDLGIANSSGEDECTLISYFNNRDYSFNIFENAEYHKIEKVFLKLNTSVTSSGSVERLFSQAKNILTISRSNLNDDMFEKLLFLKVNKNYDSNGSKLN